MFRRISILLFLCITIDSYAQESRYLRFDGHLIADGKIYQNESVKDNQGNDCALICINIPIQQVDIVGDCILGNVQKAQNGYNVFVSTWSSKKNITILTDNYYPLDIPLRTTDGKKLIGNIVYKANVLLPADVNAGRSWIKFKSKNIQFTVIINDNEYKSDSTGDLDINLPYGNYYYLVKTIDKNEIKGNITITNLPQVINIKCK